MVPSGELCSHRRRSLQERSLVLGDGLLENRANLRLQGAVVAFRLGLEPLGHGVRKPAD